MQIVSLGYINFHWGIIMVHLEYTGVHSVYKDAPCMGCMYMYGLYVHVWVASVTIIIACILRSTQKIYKRGKTGCDGQNSVCA